MQPAVKPKGAVGSSLSPASGQAADPPCTKPQYGLPTDGGAGGQSAAKPQYGDAGDRVGLLPPPAPNRSTAYRLTEVQGDSRQPNRSTAYRLTEVQGHSRQPNRSTAYRLTEVQGDRQPQLPVLHHRLPVPRLQHLLHRQWLWRATPGLNAKSPETNFERKLAS